jgi:CO/xanthine dehydrogenase Mo-binding subunit
MRSNNPATPDLSRRELLSTAAAATGALVVGFWLPAEATAAAGQTTKPEGAPWAVKPAVEEVNAWVVVAPDDTVTIRIAQTELGQGVWTSNAMMVCEELQCDWSKVSPQYASANRDGREMAPEWTLPSSGSGAGPASRVSRTASIAACAPTPRHQSRTAAIIFSLRARKRASDFCWRRPNPGALRSRS